MPYVYKIQWHLQNALIAIVLPFYFFNTGSRVSKTGQVAHKTRFSDTGEIEAERL